MPKVTADEAKFREFVLYVARESEADQSVGAVKFNKLLFNADFIAYGTFGKPITGVEYKRLPNGPAPRLMMPILERMIGEGIAARSKRLWMGTEQHRTFALRDPDVDLFDSKELTLTNQIIKAYWGLSGTAMSKISHEFLGWKLAKEGEIIPYESIFLSARDLTDNEATYALELAS